MRTSYTKAGAAFLEILEQETSVHWRGGQEPTHFESYGAISLSSEGLKTSSVGYCREEGHIEVSQDEFLAEVKKRFPKKDSGMGKIYYTRMTPPIWNALKVETGVTWVNGEPLGRIPFNRDYVILDPLYGLVPIEEDWDSKGRPGYVGSKAFLRKVGEAFPKKANEPSTADASWRCGQWSSTSQLTDEGILLLL